MKKRLVIIAIIIILIVAIVIVTINIKSKNSSIVDNDIKSSENNSTSKLDKITEPNSEEFIFVVDDVFTLTGKGGLNVKGTFPTGYIIKGNVRVRDELKIVGNDKIIPCKVQNLVREKEELESATEGESVGINLGDNISSSELARGQVITNSSNVKSVNKFKAKLHMANKEDGFDEKVLTNNSKILFDFYDAVKINAKIKFLDNINEARPGDNLNVEVELENNMAIFKDAQINIIEGKTKYATLTVTEIN